jgi:hypothetical protein
MPFPLKRRESHQQQRLLGGAEEAPVVHGKELYSRHMVRLVVQVAPPQYLVVLVASVLPLVPIRIAATMSSISVRDRLVSAVLLV